MDAGQLKELYRAEWLSGGGGCSGSAGPLGEGDAKRTEIGVARLGELGYAGVWSHLFRRDMTMNRFSYLACLLLVTAACPALAQRNVHRSGFVTEFTESSFAILVQELNPPVKTVQKLGNGLDDLTLHRFRVIAVYKAGNPPAKVGDEVDLFQPLLPSKPETKHWYTQAYLFPAPLNEESLAFVERLAKLPEKGPERLMFFQDHASSSNREIAEDCLKHLTTAPRADLLAFQSRLKHGQLVSWIKDQENSTRRRQALKLLTVCGSANDVPLLEKQIMTNGAARDLVLDDLLATYLALRGPEGLDLIDRQFLFKNAKPTQLYSILQAFRASESALPRERLIKSLRLFLAPRHQYPDLVIHDLKRLEDWASMDRIVQIFKETKEPELVHRPVFLYLLACPKPEAKAHLEELKKLDPEGYRLAERIHKLPPPKPEPEPEK